MLVADSDVLIDSLRGREPWKSRVGEGIQDGSLATTSVNLFELLGGVRTADERNKVERLLAALPILSFDEPASRRAAEVRRQLEKRGETIGTADYLIAGICLARSASLLTRNRGHFERVPGLRLGELGRGAD